MKKSPALVIFLFLFALVLLISCSNDRAEKDRQLERRLEQAEKKLNAFCAPKYQQSLADIMLSIQSRHTKLWYAGSKANWELAAFEAEELEESLEEVGTCYDQYDGLPIAHLQETLFKPSIESLVKSIEAKSVGEFESRFIDLTASCNSCHQSANHSFIVIKEPTEGLFLNQDFNAHEKK